MVSKSSFYAFLISLMIGLYLIYVFGEAALTLTLIFGVLSSTIVLTDVVRIFKGKLDLFDPSLLIGLVGIFLFLISPVCQIAWDYWPFLKNMNKNPFWIDSWAALNFLGLVVYKWSSTHNLVFKNFNGKSGARNKHWSLNENKFRFLAPVFLSICFLSQVYIYNSFGGVSGFVNAFTKRQEMGALNGNDPFEGMGMIMLIAESFKYLFAMYIIYLIQKSGRFKSNRSFLILMLFLAITFIFFGGLRGSRSSTLFPLFFAAGMYHFYVRKLSTTLVAFGALVCVIFSVSYYWYKIAGLQGIEAIYDESARTSFHSERQDSTKYMLSRDLGRMDFQSLALMKTTTGEINLSFGRTYLVAIFSSIPKSVIPFNPPQITKEKTELLYGRGAYIHGAPRQTTLVLGQFGEAIVNFGPMGGLLFYFLLGRWVYWLRRRVVELEHSDVRRLFLPALSFLPVLMLITDMNVVLYQVTRYLAIPALLLFLCARKKELKFSLGINQRWKLR